MFGVPTTIEASTSYYDKANRTIASVDVGTNGGSSYTRPGSVPSRSDTVLVTEMAYNSSGWLETTTDPKGLLGKQYYDHAGRVTKTVENDVDGTVSDSDDKTVEYTDNGLGQVKTLSARLTGGGQKVTENVFGVSTRLFRRRLGLLMQPVCHGAPG